MSPERARAVGARGSWFATVAGESLPCVHKYWWTGGRYNDTGLRPGAVKADELVAAIRAGRRVVLTDDVPEHDADGVVVRFTRQGYIAVYDVDNIEFDATGLRFDFVRRVLDLV